MERFVRTMEKTVRGLTNDLNDLVIANLYSKVCDDYCDYEEQLIANYRALKYLIEGNKLNTEYVHDKLATLKDVIKATRHFDSYKLLDATLNYLLCFEVKPTVKVSEGAFSDLEFAALKVLEKCNQSDELYEMLDSIMLSSGMIKCYTLKGLDELINKISKDKKMYANSQVIDDLDVCISLCDASNMSKYELMLSMPDDFTKEEIELEKATYTRANELIGKLRALQDELRMM